MTNLKEFAEVNNYSYVTYYDLDKKGKRKYYYYNALYLTKSVIACKNIKIKEDKPNPDYPMIYRIILVASKFKNNYENIIELYYYDIEEAKNEYFRILEMYKKSNLNMNKNNVLKMEEKVLNEYKYYESVVEDKFKYTENNYKYIQLSDFIKKSGYRTTAKIGNISYLAHCRDFKDAYEFRDFYFESGNSSLEERKKMFFNKNIPYNERKEFVEKYGRTQEELANYIRKMYYMLENDTEIYNLNKKVSEAFPLLYTNGLTNVSINQLKESFLTLLFVHTWNGLIVRENNVRYNLKQKYNSLDFLDGGYKRDVEYGIDAIVLNKNEEEKLAIQIKPEKYLKWNMPEIDKTKHKSYYDKYGIEVIYVYADELGNIKNRDIYSKISKFL